MNAFLTSIMHYKTASDFSVVEKNFERLVRSLLHQEDGDFILLVVCNQVPEINVKSDKIIYHTVDFPPANKSADTMSRRIDKGTKLISGILKLRSFRPNYVFIVDADDWLHKSINKFLNERKLHSLGWTINNGFIVDLGNKTYLMKYGLYRYCGSTFATNYEVLLRFLDFSAELSEHSSQDEIIKSTGTEIILDLFDAHGYIRFFKCRGLTYSKVPFPAVAWLRNTGENILSDGSFVNGLNISNEMVDIFSQDYIVDSSKPENNKLQFILYYLSVCTSYIGWKVSQIKEFVSNIRLFNLS